MMNAVPRQNSGAGAAAGRAGAARSFSVPGVVGVAVGVVVPGVVVAVVGACVVAALGAGAVVADGAVWLVELATGGAASTAMGAVVVEVVSPTPAGLAVEPLGGVGVTVVGGVRGRLGLVAPGAVPFAGAVVGPGPGDVEGGVGAGCARAIAGVSTPATVTAWMNLLIALRSS